MAHELDFREDGTARVFTTRQPAWHREGKVFDEPPTLDEAIHECFDWLVKLLPLQAVAEGDNLPEPMQDNGVDKVRIDVPDRYAVIRADEGKILDVVGSKYTPLQNHDAFEPVRPLLDEGLATVSTGGVLRGGEDVWMLIRFDMEAIANRVGGSVEEIFAAGDDQIMPFGLVTNNHIGKRNVQIRETPIRVVCANTLSMALSGGGQSVKVRHTGKVAEKVQDAADRLFTSILNRYELLAQSYRLLRTTTLPERAFERLVLDPVAPLKDEDELETSRARTYQEKRRSKRAEIRDLWTDGAGQSGDQSAWEAYNGLVEALDHSDRWEPRSLTRCESLVGGSLDRHKDKVGQKLIRFAEDESFREAVLSN